MGVDARTTRDHIGRRLATFASDLSLERVPATTLDALKLQILDMLGVMLAGSTTGVYASVVRAMQAMGGAPEVTVVGSPCRLPVASAAFANGTAAHVVELDGALQATNVHAHSSVVPASLAVAERTGASGQEFLLGVLAGLEVALRLGRAMFPSHSRRGFHPTGSCGTFGAAASAARLFHLDEADTEAALGLAATQAMALRGQPGPGAFEMKRVHAGKAAHNGILAALLAREGIPAAEGFLSGDRGFMRLCSDGPDLDGLLDGLGEQFVAAQCYLKPYAAVRHAHAPIDTILAFRRERAVDPALIRRIVVRIYREGALHDTREPESPGHAQFSLPYSLAVAYLDGNALLSQYSQERWSDPQLRELARKVEVRFDAEMDGEFLRTKRRAHEVRVEMDGREVWIGHTDYPKGSLNNPMSPEEVERKYFDLAEMVVDVDTALRLRESVERLERLETVEAICSCLGCPAAEQS